MFLNHLVWILYAYVYIYNINNFSSHEDHCGCVCPQDEMWIIVLGWLDGDDLFLGMLRWGYSAARSGRISESVMAPPWACKAVTKGKEPREIKEQRMLTPPGPLNGDETILKNALPLKGVVTWVTIFFCCIAFWNLVWHGSKWIWQWKNEELKKEGSEMKSMKMQCWPSAELWGGQPSNAQYVEVLLVNHTT